MMPGEGSADDRLLTPSEVAEMFRVNPKTVTRWARTGRLQAIKTIGGHRRYRLSEVRKAVEAANETRIAPVRTATRLRRASAVRSRSA